MDLQKENEQLKRQNEVLKEAISLLTSQLNFYRTNYEKVMREIQEIAQ
jgi:cell division protein FtsB